MNQHSLVGKIVKIWHGLNTAFPYQPMRILRIEDPMIELGCTHPNSSGVRCVHSDNAPKSFWVPLAACHRFDIQEEASDSASTSG